MYGCIVVVVRTACLGVSAGIAAGVFGSTWFTGVGIIANNIKSRISDLINS